MTEKHKDEDKSPETLAGKLEKAAENGKQKERIKLLQKEVNDLFAHRNFANYNADGKNRQRMGGYKKDIKREVKRLVEKGEKDIDVKKVALEYAKGRNADTVVKIIREISEGAPSGESENKKEKLKGEIEKAEKELSSLFHQLGEKFKDFLEKHKEELLFNKGLRKLIFDDLQHRSDGSNVIEKGKVSSDYLKELKSALKKAENLKKLDWEEKLKAFKKGGVRKSRELKGVSKSKENNEVSEDKTTMESINESAQEEKKLKSRISDLNEKIIADKKSLEEEKEKKLTGQSNMRHVENLKGWIAEAEAEKLKLEKKLKELQSSGLINRLKKAGADKEVLSRMNLEGAHSLNEDELRDLVEKTRKDMEDFEAEKQKDQEEKKKKLPRKKKKAAKKEDDKKKPKAKPEEEKGTDPESIDLGEPIIDNEGSEGSIDADFKVIESPEEQLDRLMKENPGVHTEVLKRGLNEETGEFFYDEASVENKILMILEEKSNKARRSYAEKDYDMDKKLGGVKRFFGRAIGMDKYEEEILEYKEDYEKAREEYKNAMLEFGGVEEFGFKGDEEKSFVLGAIAKDFQVNEQLRWRSDRLDVAMEKSPIYEKFKKYSLGMVNNYRKLRNIPAEKISKLTGSKVAGVGAGLAVVGGALKVSGLGANIPWKFFSATVATVGYKQMLESFAEKSRLKKGEKEIAGAVKGFEEGFENFDSWLSEKNKNLHENIQDEKLWRNYRTLMAGGAAIATIAGGSWLGDKVAGYFGGSAEDVPDKHQTDLTKSVSGEPAKESVAAVSEIKNEIKPTEKITPVQEAPHGAALHSEPAISEVSTSATVEATGASVSAAEVAVVTELPKSGKIDLNIKNGSSIEKTIKEFLKTHKEDFNKGKMGWGENKGFNDVDDWAGKRAHIIAKEFADKNPGIDINLVHPNTELKIDFSNKADIQISEIKGPEGAPLETAGNTEITSDAMAIGFTQRLEIDPDHYAEIKNMSVKEFVDEIKRSGNLEYGGDYMDIRLPDGDFLGSGDVENRRLGVIMSYLVDNGKINNSSQSIAEAMGSIKEEDFMSGVAHYESIFGDIPGVENSPSTGETQVESKSTVAESKVEEKISNNPGSSEKPEGKNINESSAGETGVEQKTVLSQARKEAMLANSFNLSPQEYSTIDDAPIAKLLEEVPSDEDKDFWRSKNYPGAYKRTLVTERPFNIGEFSELKKQGNLADFFRAYNASDLPKIDNNMTIGEFFRSADMDSLNNNESFDFNFSDLSDKDYDKYLQSFTESELEETRKILFNGDSKVWKSFRGKVAEGIDNETFSAAYSKINEMIGIKGIKGESIEKWTARMIKGVYEQDKISEVKEILKPVKIESK